VTALTSAPAPPSVGAPQPPVSVDDLDQLLAGVLPAGADLPTNDRFTITNRWQRLDYTHPNELIDQNGGSPDPVALQQTPRSRGYQGPVLASHTNCRALVPHQRQFDDEQLRAIIARDGLVTPATGRP